MPGTLVRDSLAPVLLNATVTATGNDTGVEVDKPALVSIIAQVTGAVTGTTPTLDLEIQGSNVSGFGSGVVSYGKFPTMTATDASSATTHVLTAQVYKKYMRTVRTAGGTTPSFGTVQVKVRLPHDRQTPTTTA